MILRSELADILTEVLAIIVVDLHTGAIVYATHEAEALFGYPLRNSLVGVNVDELVPADRKLLHQKHRKNYELDPRTRPMGTGQVLEGKKRDGTVFPVEVTLTPAFIDGDPRVVAIIVDLTQVRN